MNNILNVKNLRKNYKNVAAVDEISFNLDERDIFAFLGPNGAGKTTTLRILLDIIKPDGGSVEWNLNGQKTSVPDPRLVGYLPEERGLYMDIPVIKTLVYLASIRGMEAAKAKAAAMKWLDRLDLSARINDKLQNLSKGNQQKIQFVASILHKPKFAILDEPFSGLDPLNQENFIEFIKEINREGTTILLSAHQMSLVEKIANKVFLINSGKEIYSGSLEGLYNQCGRSHVIDLQFNSEINEHILNLLSKTGECTKFDDFNIRIEIKKDEMVNSLLMNINKLENLSGINSREQNLHEIFLKLIKKHKI